MRGDGTRQTFTLSKAAVAFAIVGLIVGGVVVGRQAVRRSELSAITVDANHFIEVTQTFRQKYSALPGDMKYATQFWGVLAGDGNDLNCARAIATGAATCNGDGDGRVAFTKPGNQESLRLWQHLANAGFLAGQYSGTAVQPIADALSTSGSEVIWLIDYRGNQPGTITEFAGKWGHVLSLSLRDRSVLFPAEAYEIDAKYDDGLPGTGKIIGFKGAGIQRCTSAAGMDAAHEAGAAYNVSDPFRDCPTLYFVRAF